MTKRERGPSPAEDYIGQLQWQSRHRRRYWPVRYEPKWKYKIVYKHTPVSPLGRAIGAVVLLGVILLIIYFVASDNVAAPTGAKIFLALWLV
jgi:hypothetical protein